jgi:hypothetical protein
MSSHDTDSGAVCVTTTFLMRFDDFHRPDGDTLQQGTYVPRQHTCVGVLIFDRDENSMQRTWNREQDLGGVLVMTLQAWGWLRACVLAWLGASPAPHAKSTQYIPFTYEWTRQKRLAHAVSTERPV